MKSLAERHVDRAQRIVNNETESTAGDVRGVIGNAAGAIIAANEAVSKLTAEEKDELRTALEGRGFDSLEASGDEPEVSLAGIGVVNPLTAGGRKFLEVAETPIQAGERPNAEFDPAEGNLNGQAIEKAGNGWGDAYAATATEKKAEAPKAEKAAAEADKK